MRRDAKSAAVLKKIDHETELLSTLEVEQAQIKRIRRKMSRQDGFELFSVWVLFFAAVIAYIFAYLFFTYFNNSIIASLLGGVAVLLTVAFVVFFRALPDRRMQRSLDSLEFLAAERSMSKELEMRRQRLFQLKESLADNQ